MTAHEVLQLLEGKGLIIEINDHGLRCHPKNLLTSEIRDLISSCRTDILSILRKREQDKTDYWGSLLTSGKSDLDVDDLNEALFLFAAQKLQTANDVAATWNQFSRYWKERLPSCAFDLIDSSQRNMKALKANGMEPKQMVLQKL